MCNRYRLGESTQLKLFAKLRVEAPTLSAVGEFRPTDRVTVIRQSGEDRIIEEMRWGFVPPWLTVSETKKLGPMTNARSDRVLESKIWKPAFLHRRCILPATAYYEWQEVPGMKRKIPYAFKRKSGELFPFAGLWSEAHDDDGNPIHTCTIITTDAASNVTHIHDRMPVILPDETSELDLWLDPNNQQPESLIHLLKPFESEDLIYEQLPVGSVR